jgi:hypothetical protein
VIIWAGGGGAVRAGAFTYRLGARWVHPQRWARDVRWAHPQCWAGRSLGASAALGAPAASLALGALWTAQGPRPLGAPFARERCHLMAGRTTLAGRICRFDRAGLG